MRITFTEADTIRIKFEAACYRMGTGLAKTVFSRALNSKGRKAFTAVKRALRGQTSIPNAIIAASTKFRQASSRNLETRVVGTGRHIPLSKFGAKQFSYGVRATVWGKTQTYPHAFWVPKYGGVYKRLSAKRFPIKQLYGPAIPVELVKDESLTSFQQVSAEIAPEAARLAALMLSGLVR